MAGKCKEMSKIKQVIRLHADGISNREIGRQLDLYKGTVNKYVKLIDADPIGVNKLLELSDPELEKRLCGGNPAYSDHRFIELQKRMPNIMQEMDRRHEPHVNLQVLWQEYKQDVPDGYEYTQFCYHYNQLAAASKPSFVMKDKWVGGQYILIDYAGDTMSYVDPETGEIIKCQVFIATLPASDYGYIKAVPSQKLEDFIYCMESCFRSLNGAPKIITTDNLKSSVVKSDRYEPELNQAMDDFANHYNCVNIPARSLKSKDKALVESQVKRSYARIYAPLRHRQFFSLEELNNALTEMMKRHNQKRMQRIPYTREELFLAQDKPALQKLNPEPFEIRYRTILKVAHNSYIYLGRDKAYYSVPYRLIGRKVKVEYTRSVVNIYSEGVCVAMHPRSSRIGEYVTIASHLPSYYEDYVNLSPEKYIERAKRVSENLPEVMTRLFASNKTLPPETFYKSCDGLLHLQKVSDYELFEDACAIALHFNRCRYSFIKNLVQSKCTGYTEWQNNEVLFPCNEHENIRGEEYYKTNKKIV